MTQWILIGIYYIPGTVLSLMNTLMKIIQSFLKALRVKMTRNNYITQCDSTMIEINKVSLWVKDKLDQLTSSGSVGGAGGGYRKNKGRKRHQNPKIV